MSEPFELPEDITGLDDEQLAAALAGAVQAFDAKAKSSLVTPTDIEDLRSLATAVEDMRKEQQDRITAAREAAAEIEQLAAQVRGDDQAAAPQVEEPAEPVVEETAAAEPDPAPEPQVSASALVKRPVLNLASVRASQPRVLPEPPAPGTHITAAVDVPGYTPGAPLDFGQVVTGIISRANALKTAGGGVGQVISYRHPFDPGLVVTDSSSAPEGTTVAIAAQDQKRLPQGDLVASGGWCAPSETLYDITGVACPDMLWDAPEIQLARGGLRYYKPLSLDVSSMTWVHTEADDISGATKPCFRIPCPDPVEVRCDAVGVCLEAGILTQRHFPELVAWYLRNAMVAHEIRIKQQLFQQALLTATPVVLAPTFGALSAIYNAIALQAADMIERHSLCDTIALEVVFPWWSRNLFLGDLARQNGVNICDLSPTCIQDVFSTLGVRVQFARGLSPAVPTDIGAANPATEWPATVNFLMYPSGSIQIGRGEEVNLGVVHDSTKFVTNDYTALFAEECVALVDRSVDTRLVTVPVCPDGATGAQLELVCAAGSS
ncbi:major capsid protein [Streptomyces sp. ND04-05B]|uniref:major capsid protein n=1 Tax=Streptomyces sp. ND04-05B TaxID=3028693 RepID=UPI0029BD70A0|nr:major capsid protein [Streptomyces sp. ND04-05B]MDX3067088.1 major capsid protein [Streptomyces sp. ND04-05B]